MFGVIGLVALLMLKKTPFDIPLIITPIHQVMTLDPVDNVATSLEYQNLCYRRLQYSSRLILK